MTIPEWARRILAAAVVVATTSAFTFLVVFHQWQARDNQFGDEMEQYLVVSALIVAAGLSVIGIGCNLWSAPGGVLIADVMRAASGGAFVATILSATTTLLLALAVEPPPSSTAVFRMSYAGLLAASLAVGLLTSWLSVRDHRSVLGAVVTCGVLTGIVWGYLAVGSSEVNRCVVHYQWPLHDTSDRACPGQ